MSSLLFFFFLSFQSHCLFVCFYYVLWANMSSLLKTAQALIQPQRFPLPVISGAGACSHCHKLSGNLISTTGTEGERALGGLYVFLSCGCHWLQVITGSLLFFQVADYVISSDSVSSSTSSFWSSSSTLGNKQNVQMLNKSVQAGKLPEFKHFHWNTSRSLTC